MDKEFDVLIKDKDGDVVVDKKLESEENGFIDVWLPRDEEFTVNIQQDGKAFEGELSTFKGDNTCITTMQLK